MAARRRGRRGGDVIAGRGRRLLSVAAQRKPRPGRGGSRGAVGRFRREAPPSKQDTPDTRPGEGSCRRRRCRAPDGRHARKKVPRAQRRGAMWPHGPDGRDGAEAPDAPKRVLAPDPDAPKLHKVLAQAGVGSRRDLEQMIADQRVTVNGELAHTGQRISFGDRIAIDGKPVRFRIAPPPPRVLAYHKPAGEVVSHDDPQQRPTVFRRLPRLQHGKWQSVGRLDINTEGLLLFTTSGELANQLMHPRFGVEREYAVRSLGVLEPEAKGGCRRCHIEGPALRFKETKKVRRRCNHWYRASITEGRNRGSAQAVETGGQRSPADPHPIRQRRAADGLKRCWSTRQHDCALRGWRGPRPRRRTRQPMKTPGRRPKPGRKPRHRPDNRPEGERGAATPQPQSARWQAPQGEQIRARPDLGPRSGPQAPRPPVPTAAAASGGDPATAKAAAAHTSQPAAQTFDKRRSSRKPASRASRRRSDPETAAADLRQARDAARPRARAATEDGRFESVAETYEKRFVGGGTPWWLRCGAARVVQVAAPAGRSKRGRGGKQGGDQPGPDRAENRAANRCRRFPPQEPRRSWRPATRGGRRWCGGGAVARRTAPWRRWRQSWQGVRPSSYNQKLCQYD